MSMLPLEILRTLLMSLLQHDVNVGLDQWLLLPQGLV